MNTKKFFTGLLVSLSLTACSSTETVTNTISPLPTAQVCCSDFSQFPWIQLNNNEDINFQIDSSSSVGHFTDGNSYFNAFRLSPRSQKVTLRLSSLMSEKSVVAPKVITLDEKFNIVKVIELKEFEVKTSSAFTQSQFRLNFELDATKTPYFIVYSSSEYLGQSVKVKHPARVRAEEFGEPMPMVTDPTYQFSRFGKLTLSIKTESLKASRPALKEVEVMETKVKVPAKPALPETQAFYKMAITEAVNSNDIAKALSLLEEAKKLSVEGAQTIFIEALEKKEL